MLTLALMRHPWGDAIGGCRNESQMDLGLLFENAHGCVGRVRHLQGTGVAVRVKVRVSGVREGEGGGGRGELLLVSWCQECTLP